MADIIQLLPDNIANQIAAGEVIQRPASVVKELIENSIDAGATEIKLLLKDAGKTLIHVIDNGKGMSETDARMSFERHATSKIRNANDLFTIQTKGFRGEALASIAAIAHVDLLTKTADEQVGRRLVVKGSKVEKQEPHQANTGSSFAVKNLFYNVPARRKFLKSDPVELKHIIEEFKRTALAHEDIFFSMYHNENEVYYLPATNRRQRIVGVFGKSTNEKLVPVQEETDVFTLSGFVGKPEHAKKTKGEQFLFVNNRFIKSNYLNHAIRGAYENLIVKEVHPFYALYLDVPPSQIDINVHPTKTEIKFEEERLIYNYIKVAVKHALGQFNVVGSLDFGSNINFDNKAGGQRDLDAINKEYNFSNSGSHRPPNTDRFAKSNLDAWEQIYSGLQNDATEESIPTQDTITLESKITSTSGEEISNVEEGKEPYQIHSSYILTHIKSGYMLIDQQSAHERILYEDNIKNLSSHQRLTQKELFPRTIELDNAKTQVLKEILPKINALGFEVEAFGQNSYLVHGIPAGLPEGKDAVTLVEQMLDQYTSNVDLDIGIEENVARSLAVSAAIKRGKRLAVPEMRLIIDRLFACEMPFKSPTGRKCFISKKIDDLTKEFL